MILRTRSLCRNCGMAAEIAGPRSSRNRRTPPILRREVLPILTGQMLVLGLRRERSCVLLVLGGLFLRCGTRCHAALPTVEGHMILVHDYGSGVDISDAGDADIRDGRL